MTAKKNLLNLTPAAALQLLEAAMAQWGQPAYRARQVARHLWVAPTADFSGMTDLPESLREQLAAVFDMPRLTLSTEVTSTDGTRKFLFQLRDGQAIETVAIPDGDRVTL